MTTHPAPTCRDWPAGTRVRCVDARNLVNIAAGDELTVDIDCGEWLHFRELRGCGSYSSYRFKPVVRVPMGRKVETKIATLTGYASRSVTVVVDPNHLGDAVGFLLRGVGRKIEFDPPRSECCHRTVMSRCKGCPYA